MFEPVVTRIASRGLRGIWVRRLPEPGPAVWAANHHAWWDPFIATAVSRRMRSRSAVLMLQDNLDTFRFARAIGAFGTRELRQGLRFLAEGRQLVVYPEGELSPPGPLRELADGAAWYARTGNVPLYAMSCRVVMRGQQWPEAYVSFSKVATSGSRTEITCRLAAQLIRSLSDVDNLIESSDPRTPLPGFTLAVAGRRSPDERITALGGRWPWRR